MAGLGQSPFWLILLSRHDRIIKDSQHRFSQMCYKNVRQGIHLQLDFVFLLASVLFLG
jgi:hypothetical protein